jgi:hypothetical protein
MEFGWFLLFWAEKEFNVPVVVLLLLSLVARN